MQLGREDLMSSQLPATEWIDRLVELPLFSDLPKRQVRRIAALAIMRRYQPRDVVVRAGSPGDGFFVVLEGVLLVKRVGKPDVRLRKGDSFGELALLDGAPRTVTVEVDPGDEVLTMWVGRSTFVKMLEREPKIAVVLLKTMAGRLRASEKSGSG
jgi:CRP/FNR family cyclic AMP-dependent transcriptional regulator